MARRDLMSILNDMDKSSNKKIFNDERTSEEIRKNPKPKPEAKPEPAKPQEGSKGDQGTPVGTTATIGGKKMKWNGTKWVPVSGGSSPSPSSQNNGDGTYGSAMPSNPPVRTGPRRVSYPVQQGTVDPGAEGTQRFTESQYNPGTGTYGQFRPSDIILPRIMSRPKRKSKGKR